MSGLILVLAGIPAGAILGGTLRLLAAALGERR